MARYFHCVTNGKPTIYFLLSVLKKGMVKQNNWSSLDYFFDKYMNKLITENSKKYKY